MELIIDILLDVLMWFICWTSPISESHLNLIPNVYECFIIMVFLTIILYIIPSKLYSRYWYRNLNQQQKTIEDEKERLMNNLYDSISRYVEENSYFLIGKRTFEERQSDVKSLNKDSFFMYIKESSSFDDCFFLRVFIKEKGIVKSYLIPIYDPCNMMHSISKRTITYAVHYVNVSFLLEMHAESSCYRLQTVIHAVLVIFGYIKNTDAIELLCGTERIPMSSYSFLKRIFCHPITAVVTSSHGDDSDQDIATIEYTPKTINDFLSRKRYYSKTIVILNIC